MTRELLAQAIRHIQAGELPLAEQDCRRILNAQPGHADALHLLGAIALQAGDLSRSIDCVRRAIAQEPRNAVYLNTLGIANAKAGRADDAVAAFEAALAIQPRFAEALNNLGNVLKSAERVDEAAQCYEKALAIQPDYADALNNVGDALTMLGRPREAIGRLERALQLRPTFVEALHNLGRALQAAGDTAAAIAAYERAITLRPGYFEALNNLGSAFQDRGELDQASRCFREVVRLAPAYPEGLNNLGNVLHALGQFAEAQTCLRRALETRPRFAEAHVNQGNVFRELGLLDQARKAYETALSFKPGLAEAHNNLGNLLIYEKRTGEALSRYQEALRLKPSYADARYNVGNALYEQGLLDDARQAFRAAVDLSPHKPLWKLRRESLCPHIFASPGEIDAFRAQLEHTLDELLEAPPRLQLREIAASACEPPFALNYHGRGNLTLKQKYARLFEPAVAPHTAPFGTGRPTVGFVVTRGHEGIFLRSTKGIINRLSHGVFRLLVIASAAALPRVRREITHPDVEFVGIAEHAAAAVEIMRGLGCDLLYHWEISSDTLNYLLALHRLAPIQCTSWGIQDTSGVPNIDVYLSNKLLELEGNQRLYSEELALLETLPTYQYRGVLDGELRDRAHFGLSDRDHVYLCAQNLLKFHPDFDPLLAEILRRDGHAKLVITASENQPHVQAALRARFTTAMPDVVDRIMFLPRQRGADYLSLVRQADALLDPPHFCGVNTSYDGFSMGTPVVAFPTEFQRTRYTSACYQKMGINGLVATTASEYVEIALRLGADRDYRAAIESLIQERSPVLFEEQAAVAEHEAFFLSRIEAGRAGAH